MSYPSFSVGDVLAASDMNAVGLWRITNCTVTSTGGTSATASNGVITIGNGNTNVRINNAFSADYDFYKIIFSGGGMTGDIAIQMRMGTGTPTTGYYWSSVLGRYDNLGSLAGGGTNVGLWAGVGFGSTTGILCEVEVTNPFTAHRTGIKAQHWDTRTGGGTGYGVTGGHLADTTSYTDCQFIASSGSFTGGSIRVYGYRK